MATDVIIPTDWWDDDSEAVITQWLADDGANVREGVLIVEIMVNKVQCEIYAPASGKLSIYAGNDAVVTKGAVIASIA